MINDSKDERKKGLKKATQNIPYLSSAGKKQLINIPHYKFRQNFLRKANLEKENIFILLK